MGTSSYPLIRDYLPQPLIFSLWSFFLPDPNLPSYKLKTRGFGMTLQSPIGLSDLDINGGSFPALLKHGYSFVELGPTVQQPEGFSRPFYQANPFMVLSSVTSYGLNSIEKRLRKTEAGPRGVNVAALKEKIEIIPNMTDEDFQYILIKLYHLCDFFSINLCSSPDKDMEYYQKPVRLRALLKKLTDQRNFEIGLYAAYRTGFISYIDTELRRLYCPIYVKVNSDWQDIESLVESCVEYGIDGIIVGDTQDDLEKSLLVLNKVVKAAKGRLEIVSFGGIRTGQEVLERIKAGAKLVQIFAEAWKEGPWVLGSIHKELEEALKKEGFLNIEEAFNYYNKKAEYD